MEAVIVVGDGRGRLQISVWITGGNLTSRDGVGGGAPASGSSAGTIGDMDVAD